MSGVMKGARVPEILLETLRKTQTPEWQARADAQFEDSDREWIGLTEEQFVEAARLAEDGNYLVAFQRIQQWLKEKNT